MQGVRQGPKWISDTYVKSCAFITHFALTEVLKINITIYRPSPVLLCLKYHCIFYQEIRDATMEGPEGGAGGAAVCEVRFVYFCVL